MPCNHPDCKTLPIYNYEGETKAIYCATHKLDGMIDVKNKSCNHPDCKTQPIYNYKWVLFYNQDNYKIYV